MSEYEKALLEDLENEDDIEDESGSETWSTENMEQPMERASPNGTSPNGTSPNGTSPNGTSPNGTSPNGTSPNGTSHLKDTKFEAKIQPQPNSTHEPFNDSQESQFTQNQPSTASNLHPQHISIIHWLLQKHHSSLKVGSRLQQIDTMKPMSVQGLSSIIGHIPEIRKELAQAANNSDYHELLAHMAQQSESAEYRFLVSLSALPSIIQEEIALLYRYVCVHYKVVFPELETLVTSSEAYCAVVVEIGQDLAAIRAHEPNLKRHVSGEKLLTIVMAALHQQSRSFTLSESDMKKVIEACDACIQLHRFLREIARYIAGKLAHFAPNLTALVGPITSSQLLMGLGSLVNLASTPACNLSSLGSRELSIQYSRSSVKNTGYIFYSPILQGLPPEILRSALRVLCAKVVLAARVDLARSCTDGAMGKQYHQQVQEQIERLLTPPERVKTKALPVPEEQKSKKRAGRRFRKMRERFQMSELRKAQNKVQFGKEEDHVMDGYGEEVGLGMSRQSDSVQVNRNTDARMSKAMVSRLQQQKGRETLETMEDTIVITPRDKRKSEDERSEWGTMKRKRIEK